MIIYVSSLQQLPLPPPSVTYTLGGSSSLAVDGRVREHACEIMFEQDNEPFYLLLPFLSNDNRIPYCVF